MATKQAPGRTAVGIAVGSAAPPTAWFRPLAEHQFVTLATRRRSGVVVPTTVWFALDGDVVYVRTDRECGKVKRLRNDPWVTLQPCSVRGAPRGEAIEGVATIMPRDEQARPQALLAARYGWRRRLFEATHRERMRLSELIEIRPPG